jgi:hypothetical protein
MDGEGPRGGRLPWFAAERAGSALEDRGRVTPGFPFGVEVTGDGGDMGIVGAGEGEEEREMLGGVLMRIRTRGVASCVVRR